MIFRKAISADNDSQYVGTTWQAIEKIAIKARNAQWHVAAKY